MSSSKYPSTMSCRDAFDQLTTCFSIGGQFRNYYRRGEFNPCEQQLSKFKFCIMNGSDPVQIQGWYKQQAEKNKATNGNSDDIWEER